MRGMPPPSRPRVKSSRSEIIRAMRSALLAMRWTAHDPSPESVLDAAVEASPLRAKYWEAVERESALEMLTEQEASRTAEEEQARLEAENARIREAAAAQAERERLAAEKQAEKDRSAAARAEKDDPGVVASVVKSSAFRSMLRSAGTVIGREITRSVFGNSRRR